ncbi:MAG: SAM-dependent methyltransferase [Planctomycetota bacterium]
MNPTSSPTFSMVTCANGAEKAVKAELDPQGWRLAFSRPGFVTLKNDDGAGLPRGVFIRAAAHSIGSAKSDRSSDLIKKLVGLMNAKNLVSFDQLHVWPRDRLPIGKFGFEPQIDELSRAAADELLAALRGRHVACDQANRIAESEERVLDVVLVEPNQWFLGWHVASDWPTRWPGAIQPISPREEPVSRAYFKAAEAIVWSGFQMNPGEQAVEVGSSPGGVCGRLLELGLDVIGIDPANMDERISKHPHFRHVRARAGDLKRSVFRNTKWLLVDSNVKPDQTLTTVEKIVTHSSSRVEGILLTLKLGDYQKHEALERWIDRIRTWDPAELRIRQLARNKCEVCCAIRMR